VTLLPLVARCLRTAAAALGLPRLFALLPPNLDQRVTSGPTDLTTRYACVHKCICVRVSGCVLVHVCLCVWVCLCCSVSVWTLRLCWCVTVRVCLLYVCACALVLALILFVCASVPRPWLLAVVRGAASPGGALSFATDTLLPLIASLHTHATAATSAAPGGRPTLEAIQYRALAGQAWALLPGVCNAPADVITVR
jgi:hypothetical protein